MLRETYYGQKFSFRSLLAESMWCFARFGTICTILKTWKTPIEEWSLKPAILLWVTLLHGCFHVLSIVQTVPNRAEGLIYIKDFAPVPFAFSLLFYLLFLLATKKTEIFWSIKYKRNMGGHVFTRSMFSIFFNTSLTHSFPNALFLYPAKTSENFTAYFTEQRKGTLGTNGLRLPLQKLYDQYKSGVTCIQHPRQRLINIWAHLCYGSKSNKH